MDFYSWYSSKETAQSSYSLRPLYYFKQDGFLWTGSCICKVSCSLLVSYLLCCIWITTRYQMVGKVVVLKTILSNSEMSSDKVSLANQSQDNVATILLKALAIA